MALPSDVVLAVGEPSAPAVDDVAVVTAVRRRRSATDVLRLVPIAICVLWLGLVVFGAIAASWLPLQDPAKVNPVDRLQGPSGAHWFGTDNLGRDLFTRSVFGSRVSLIVSVSSTAIGLTIGSSLGIMAGYLRGRADGFISWLVDVILSFPGLVLLIALVAYLGPGLRNISLGLGFLAIPVYARLARAHAMSVSSEEYVLAARAGGSGRARILWREIMPNVLPSILAYGLVSMSLAIVIEGSLSFLGLSASIPTPSWGGLIASGQGFLRDSPTGVILPAAVLCATVLSLNVIGERMRRRFEVGQGG
ncbi:MAG: ABC transporter permease [Ilumatobacteraceae bacterium]